MLFTISCFNENLKHLFLLALAALSLQAQTFSISGHVTDESGAAVPGATVVAQGPVTKSVKSQGDGTYQVNGLKTGTYAVTATAPQLATPKALSIQLTSTNQTLELRLGILTRAEQVTVAADGVPTVTTDPANNASAIVLTGKDLDALADDPEDLQADLQALAGPGAGPGGGSIFIDGFSGGQLPPKESIREIRINSNPFTPEYDKLGFGRIEIFTKPGTDKFKGNLGYNFGTDKWNSRNPYSSEKAPLTLHEFENSISGPLTKLSSFTLDLQRQAVDNGYISNGVVLDPVTRLPVAFNSIFKTPQRRINVSPRVDYQLTPNVTVTGRYYFSNTQIAGAGIGGFDLISRGYTLNLFNNTIQLGATVVHGNIVNETRFQYFGTERSTTPNSTASEIQVLGAFNGGGSTSGNGYDRQDNFELQNNTSVLKGAHLMRFGIRMRENRDDNISHSNFNGTFTFQSISQYQLGIASQYSITTGTPELKLHQFDAALFWGDDWRVSQNLTLSYGLRYENQTNISDHKNFAPRIGLAWAPKGLQKKKTVIRAGFGIFYDRFALANTLTADRFNGTVQQQYVITNPGTYPNTPALGAQSAQVRQTIDPSLSAPYLLQSAITLERQVTKTMTISSTYSYSHGVHLLRSLDVNAPRNGIYPLGTSSPVFEATSTGIYNQNRFVVNASIRPLPQLTLFSYYVISSAKSNTDGLGTFPANPYNWSGEYGPASTDVRHNFLIGGSILARWNIRVSPYVTLQSGAPFDITAGQDLFGTTLYNGRPGIAPLGRVGAIQTAYGLLDPNPIAGETILPRNFGRGPGQVNFQVRFTKSIGIGPRKEQPASAQNGGPNVANMSQPGGMRGVFGTPSSDRKYTLNIGLATRNLTNHNNPGPIIGNIQSSLFGRANSINGGPNNEGFSENASNRKLELQIKLVW